MKLESVCVLIVDCPHTTAKDEGEGYALIRTPNIGIGHFILDGVHRVSKDVYDQRNLRAVPQAGDLILAREAPVGNVAIIPKGEQFCLGQRTVLIRPDDNKVNPYYLNYYLNSPAIRHELTSNANGATVAHLNMPKIRNLEIQLPDRKVQDIIASILSAYDDMIANCKKQIALLEEAAQRLYREWFLDMRFLGYESTPVGENGLPEGWQKAKLPEIATIRYGYPFNAKKFNTEGLGTPIIRIRNIPDSTTADFTSESVDSKYIVRRGDILVGMDGEFHINSWADKNAYLVQRVCTIDPSDENIRGYLFWAIQAPIKFFEATITGATVAHLGKKHLDSIDIIIPPISLIEPFNSYFHERLNLMVSIRKLIVAKSILLPRLISGEIKIDA